MKRCGDVHNRCRVIAASIGCAAVLWAALVSVCGASPGVTWSIQAQAAPSQFSFADGVECNPSAPVFCDALMVSVQNLGGAESPGGLKIKDQLPAGFSVNTQPQSNNEGWACEGSSTVSCTYGPAVPSRSYAAALRIYVNPPSNDQLAVVENVVRAEGGGAVTPAVRKTVVPVNGVRPTFSVREVEFEPALESGFAALGAGTHPWALTAGFFVPSVHTSPKGTASGSNSTEGPYEPVKNIKTAVFELPFGMAGDPQSAVQCTEAQLDEPGPEGGSNCPAASAIGTIALAAGSNVFGELGVSGEQCCSAVFNVKPQRGYPAEFGFKFARNIPVYMYPSLVRAPSGVFGIPPGYRLRVVAAGIPNEVEAIGVALTVFAKTAKLDAKGDPEAYVTNPAQCGAGPEKAGVELEAWTEPGVTKRGETVAYPTLTGCELLGFAPALQFQPSNGLEGSEPGSSVADEPSGYVATVGLPQTAGFEETASSDIRNAVVTLPAGVSVNPAAGQGLEGCDAAGPRGINIGSDEFGHFGADLGDPEATELGAGHPGGNGSPYDDGVYHTAPGHCPEHSIIGTAEISTPLLPEPLKGHVYIATPKCGGDNQPACTTASATNGELYGAYLEVSGSGTIAKLASTLYANPATGQLTASFRENPELPVSEVKISLMGGPRAALANPQTCGNAETTGSFESWSSTTPAETSFAFPVTGCAASMGFAPGFTAGTENSAAGKYSAFALRITRQDREQDISGVSVTTPAGLGAILANVPRCPEPQASLGTCSPESRIGHVTVQAGPGEKPLALTGNVYLTGPYKGAPFGLSIVVPIEAGPFHLGDEVVRSAISINPSTAAVTTTSDPAPQIKDGVPTRLRTIEVAIDRNDFFYNPTNCETQKVTATITAAQGAIAHPEMPFTASNCAALSFKPSFSASTNGRTSKKLGASLNLKVSQVRGEANIKKLNLTLPINLPSRQSSFKFACTQAQFNANPAGCPAGSVVGRVTVHTPALASPLTGPAYLVSHAGESFPPVEIVLQGEGITVIVESKTQIKKEHGVEVTHANVEASPDAPIESFEASFPEKPLSLLAAFGNLCAPTETVTVHKKVKRRVHGHIRRVTVTTQKTIAIPLTMPTSITAQNGRRLTQNTKITVSNCPKSKTARTASHKAKLAGKHNKR